MIRIAEGLSKISTSRWREAIRSGEVGPETADTIRQRMGFNSEEFGQRMIEGAKKRAKNLGVGYFEHTPKAYWNDILQGIKTKNWRPLGERAQGFPTAIMGGGGGYNPSYDRIDLMPGQKATGKGMMPMVSQHEGTEAAIGKPLFKRENLAALRHSYRQIPAASENRLSKIFGFGREMLHGRPGIQKAYTEGIHNVVRGGLPLSVFQPMLPDTVRMPFPGIHTSQHMSARLPIQDLREANLLGGQGAKGMRGLREMTGEAADVHEVAKLQWMENLAKPGRNKGHPYGSIPRGQVGNIARGMKDLNAARAARIAEGGQLGPMATRIARGIGSGVGKAVPIARGLASRLRGGIGSIMKLLGK